MNISIQKMLMVTLIFSFALSGCDSSGVVGKVSKVSLSFATTNSSSNTKMDNSVIQNSHLTITEAKVLLREIKFKNDMEDDGISDDSLDFSTDPFVVNLNLDGSLNEVAVTDVPTGIYDEVEFDVHKPEENETPPDPEFKTGTSGDERFSVIVKGTYNGEEFVYRSSDNMQQEQELSPPLSISDSAQNINITMAVNLSQWFMSEEGNPLDPANPDNENAIDKSIERSFEDVFEDSDRDGEDD